MYYVLNNWTIYHDIGAGKPAKYRKVFSSRAAAVQWIRVNKPGRKQ